MKLRVKRRNKRVEQESREREIPEVQKPSESPKPPAARRFPKVQTALAAAAVLLFAAVMCIVPEEIRPAWVSEWLAGMTAGASSAESPDAAQLEVIYLDVGQADSILLRLPDGRNMLIDAGNNADGAKVAAYLQSIGVTRLDWVVGTHPHEDHIGGLDTVIAQMKVGRVLLPEIPDDQVPTTRTYMDVLDAMAAKNLRADAAKAGRVLVRDRTNDLKIQVLSPQAGAKFDGLNNYSVVLRLTYGSCSFLFTGDAETAAEAAMLASGAELHADVLKLGHHGSSTSTSQAFLDRVHPQYAIISCGKGNDYGHPHKETLARIRSSGAQLYRTDRQGGLRVTCSGTSITVETGLPSCDGNAA